MAKLHPNYTHITSIYSRVVGEKVMRCTVDLFPFCNCTLLPKRAKRMGVKGWEETCQTQGSREVIYNQFFCPHQNEVGGHPQTPIPTTEKKYCW